MSAYLQCWKRLLTGWAVHSEHWADVTDVVDDSNSSGIDDCRAYRRYSEALLVADNTMHFPSLHNLALAMVLSGAVHYSWNIVAYFESPNHWVISSWRLAADSRYTCTSVPWHWCLMLVSTIYLWNTRNISSDLQMCCMLCEKSLSVLYMSQSVFMKTSAPPTMRTNPLEVCTNPLCATPTTTPWLFFKCRNVFTDTRKFLCTARVNSIQVKIDALWKTLSKIGHWQERENVQLTDTQGSRWYVDCRLVFEATWVLNGATGKLMTFDQI